MNSDPLTPNTAAPDGAPTEEAPPRRRSSRRSASAAPESAAPTETPAEAAPETPARTRRRRTAATAETAAPDDEAPATSASPRRSRARRTPSPEAAPTAPAVDEVILPLNAGDALVAESAAGDELAAEGALARPRRRRRGRGGRGGATDDVSESADTATTALLDEEPEPLLAALAENGAAEAQEDTVAEATTGTGRRRRRRGRGGRGAEGAADTAEEAAISAAEGAEDNDALATGLAEPDLAAPESTDESLSPAVLRRFDHRNWRDRPARPVAQGRAAGAAPSESREALPFRRPERGARSFDRSAAYARPEPSADLAPRPMPDATTAPPVTPRPIVAPPQAVPSVAQPPQAAPAAASAVAPPSPIVLPHSEPAPAPQGGSLEERLERLLVGQATLLQQQQQALASLTATMSSLQETIQRMTTTGIAAGMPRAGIFVDAPNVVYAAENARVTIDYGRMLDFLGRGREMVHAIVYAPVTEEAGYRFEGQRFVAPFLQKGYKLVTKPLKRFPDGTAKGNFDIELAIDIVTMSQRLDVVILISGDSDFSRLIELIQSRGVRVEVAAFASNVSWELVQMADVFIDIGQYLHEFRAQ